LLSSSSALSFCYLFSVCLLFHFHFLLEEMNGRFKRQSSISLSSNNDEYNESYSLSLSKLLTTLAAFFPTKGELTSLRESFEKVSAITLSIPFTQSNCGPYSST
jgi:hypothetical protein